MKKLFVLVLTCLLFFTNATLALADSKIQLPKIHLNSPSLTFTSSTYSNIEEVQKQLEAKSVNLEVYSQADVQYGMKDESDILMSNMKNRNNHNVLILIATNRVNRLGSRPAIRLVATQGVLSQKETSALIDAYYLDFSNKDFDYALNNMVTSIGTSLKSYDAASQDASDLFLLLLSVLIMILFLWFITSNSSSSGYSSGGDYDSSGSSYSSDSSDGDS